MFYTHIDQNVRIQWIIIIFHSFVSFYCLPGRQLVFDDDSIASHLLTTKEIKICCRDIKVLGRREVRDLLNWHKKYNKEKAQLEEETANQVYVVTG